MNDDQPTPFASHALPEMGIPVERSGFFALLNRAVRFAEAESAPVLVLIELSGLAEVAVRHGPAPRHQLAQAAASRIAETLGEQGYVCALHDHRLAVLIASDGQASPDSIATRLLAHLATPLQADGVVLAPGARLGMARWDVDGITVDELLVAADVAMHHAADSPVAAPRPAPFTVFPSPLARRA